MCFVGISKVPYGALWFTVIMTCTQARGMNVGLCLRTSLIYDVYDCIESTEVVE